ncbi:MAG: UDP-3-O-(3-hydroxymyristoyl)glucosamine N-acyltransferase [Chitinophagales bacterium]
MRTLKEILKAIGLGDLDVPEMLVRGPAKLSEATNQDLSFLANMKYENELYSTNAGAVLIPFDFQPAQEVSAHLIRVDDPHTVIAKVLELYSKVERSYGVHQQALIEPNVQLGDHIYVGPFTYIDGQASIGDYTTIAAQVYIGKNVSIGRNCDLHAGVKIYNNCVIGDNCIIHSGTVIGADGFGFVPQKDGSYNKVPQTGNVVIKNNVEIGSNCTIDRATMGSTLIGNGVKLDNLIQVGHNAEIGDNTVVAAQSGISGSTKLGEGCMIGGQVGFVGHITIAPFTMINAKSGISKSVQQPGSKLNGIPAFSFNDSLRSQSIYRKLPELQKRLSEIEEILSLHRK